MSGEIEHPAAQAVILLVEDEALVRANAAEAFRDAGFTVVEAAHADEALAAMASVAGGIHALFTDVQMPGGSMDGVGLAHHTRAAWPWVAIVIASGNADPSRLTLPERCGFVRKPYRLGAVVQQFRELTAVRH